jgi:hypothetical protein
MTAATIVRTTMKSPGRAAAARTPSTMPRRISAAVAALRLPDAFVFGMSAKTTEALNHTTAAE